MAVCFVSRSRWIQGSSRTDLDPPPPLRPQGIPSPSPNHQSNQTVHLIVVCSAASLPTLFVSRALHCFVVYAAPNIQCEPRAHRDIRPPVRSLCVRQGRRPPAAPHPARLGPVAHGAVQEQAQHHFSRPLHRRLYAGLWLLPIEVRLLVFFSLCRERRCGRSASCC